MRLIVFTLLIQLTMGSGCHSGQKASGPSPDDARFVLNGTELELDQEAADRLLAMVLDLFSASDEFYELLVTDNLVRSIRDNEEWLEVILTETKTVQTLKFGEAEVRILFIPLTGKYAGGDQLTFFSGPGDLSNTPLVKMVGLAELQVAVRKWE